MSSDFGLGHIAGLRKKATLTTLFLTISALIYAAILLVFAGPAEHALYGGKYALYVGLIPMFALIPVCTGFATGYSMALRACQKPHFDLLSNGVAAPLGVLSCVLFIHWWGIKGAVASMVLGFAAYALVYFRSYKVTLGVGQIANGTQLAPDLQFANRE
jgi:O-antigen/teichoic acid export membrane protein